MNKNFDTILGKVFVTSSNFQFFMSFLRNSTGIYLIFFPRDCRIKYGNDKKAKTFNDKYSRLTVKIPTDYFKFVLKKSVIFSNGIFSKLSYKSV